MIIKTVTTTKEINNYKKLKTGIDGLDSLLYGGIHLEEESGGEDTLKGRDGGLLILARGVHGVNKVHLAMQMCEGLFLDMPSNSIFIEDKQLQEKRNKQKSKYEEVAALKEKKVMFVSLNKNKERLRDTYIGFYFQRLINDVRIGKLDEDKFKDIITKFEWIRIDSPITQEKVVMDFANGIISGAVFYDERTYCLCEKIDNGESKNLFKIDMDKTAKKMNIGFVGRKDPLLYTDEFKEDTLASFDRMLNSLHDLYEIHGNNEDVKEGIAAEKNQSKFDCILIDGLSRLTEEEISRCRFTDLTDILRKMSKVGVITADEKLSPTGISVDIVIEMVIHEEHHPDCLQNALKISKCLYQKHVYGWHSYKMRRTGIEVIPSLHFQMNSRFHMDDSVREATLDYDEIPYELWTRERNCETHPRISGYMIPKGKEFYRALSIGKLIALGVNMLDDGSYLLNKIDSWLEDDANNSQLLFIDLSRNRTEFYKNYHEQIEKLIDKKQNQKLKVHLFNFRPGHIHDDDFLYTIEKQVRAIIRRNYGIIDEEKIKEEYKKIHLVIGDINYINFAYPCLNRDNMLLPAISNFTKKYHMTNFIYTTASLEIPILDKEKELYQQLKMVSNMLF